MRAMVLDRAKGSLVVKDIQKPSPTLNQVLVKVEACGVCRTDMHLLDGDLPNIPYPIIPGHQIVGRVEACGSLVKTFKKGDRVGIPWLGKTCGNCIFCKKNLENLCDKAEYTGYTLNGGFAEYATVDCQYCFPLSSHFDP